MICLNCDSEHFSAGEAEVQQEFRGETLAVKTPVVVCQACGWQTVGNDQIDELRRRTADTHRKKHGLLTTAQIVAMREALGMSQATFAKFLRVGEASVKRWETWLVQDASNDELMRVKCVMAKKAEIIKRVTSLLLDHAATATPATDWQKAVDQAQPLLASLGKYLQIAQPGAQCNITVNVNLRTDFAHWLSSAQTTAMALQHHSTLYVPKLQPPGIPPQTEIAPFQVNNLIANRFGVQTLNPATRLADSAQKGDTTNEFALAAAA